MNLTVDFRTQSDYGTIRAYAAIIAQQSQNDASLNGSVGILRAFIQFAGFTVGHAVSFFDFINGGDYGYIFSSISAGTAVNGTDLIGYTWQIGNGLTSSIDLEDGGNGSVGISGTGRGKVLINTSMPGVLGTSSAATTVTNDAARAMQPDIVANLRLDQAWGSAQIMAALHNASGGYYSGVPGAINASLTGSQSFGHPGEAWGWAVGGGAKIANFLLPRDTIEFEADYCHGALGYCIPPIVYSNDWVYGGGNTLAMGYSTDGVFNNGGQVQLTRLRPFPSWIPALLEHPVENFSRRRSDLHLLQQQRQEPALWHGSGFSRSWRRKQPLWLDPADLRHVWRRAAELQL